MIWFALLLILIGFILVSPRGSTPGGVAHRAVPMLGQQIAVTPGYAKEIPKGAWKFRVVGAALLLAGFALAFAVS